MFTVFLEWKKVVRMGLHVYCTVDSITVSGGGMLESLPAYTKKCFSSGIFFS